MCSRTTPKPSPSAPDRNPHVPQNHHSFRHPHSPRRQRDGGYLMLAILLMMAMMIIVATYFTAPALVKQIKADFTQAQISPKLMALLFIAGKVQQDGKLVTAADVERARKAGATDLEIHDTVLITAAFCMYNRYVDGLGTYQPDDPAFYRERGTRVARDGYVAVSEEYLAAHSPAGAAR